MSTIPPPDSRHDIAELLRLIGAVRRLALEPPPAAGGIGRTREAVA
jgi:hypothetical protein